MEEEKEQLTEVWYPSKDSMRILFDQIKFPSDFPYIRLSFLVPKQFEHKEGTVVDFESTGLPNNRKARVITVGFFYGRLVQIYQAHLQFKLAEFQNVMKNILLNKPLPFICYSPELEHGFSKYGKKHFSKVWVNILQWGWAESRYDYGDYYQYRKKLVHCVASPRDDYLGRRVPDLWFDYWKNGNFDSLFEIVYHNILDVLRESYVSRKINQTERYTMYIVNNQDNIIEMREVKNYRDSNDFYAKKIEMDGKTLKIK